MFLYIGIRRVCFTKVIKNKWINSPLLYNLDLLGNVIEILKALKNLLNSISPSMWCGPLFAIDIFENGGVQEYCFKRLTRRATKDFRVYQ